MSENLNLGDINKKYKYSNIKTVNEFIEAENFINEILDQKIYYSYNAEKRRIMIHRFHYRMDKVKDSNLFFNSLVNDYLLNFTGNHKLENLKEIQYISAKNSSNIRKVIKIVDDNKIKVVFYSIEYDILQTSSFEKFTKDGKEYVKVFFQIKSPIPFEPFSLKSLLVRMEFKKNSKRFNKNIKSIIKKGIL